RNMFDKMKSPGTPRRSKGREFKPREPYTLRLRKILEEYPDGSQVLREILQNSDDAKSTEQVFILDHNTYPSNSVFEPDLENNYQRTDLKLDRYQGPALLSRNNTIFEERDFQSLLKLANSEKRDQFDKIGVMGVGFNSIYHITDSPSFITDDKYVILDPHEWYFEGGVQFDFVKENLAKEYPHQFAPFRIPCDKPFKGTLFRYPLRTTEDSIDSDISKKIYKPENILELFQKFYENESINCLLFLKYIECISFFELKVGTTKLEKLYTIRLENATQIRDQRQLIVKKIVSMMDSLKSKNLKGNQLHTTYVASFSQQKGDSGENREESSWLILNYLDDIYEVEAHFQEKFNKDIGEYKFIPNVGLAIPLNKLNIMGRLFCFLPLPVSTPFQVSVNGYFATKVNDVLKIILETEWIPTVDASEKKIFSKRQNCYSQKDKYLVCLVTPLLEYKIKNKRFLKYLKWDTYPEVKTVLKQLELCCVSVSNKQPPEHLEMICNAIYKYINDALRANDETSKIEVDFMKKCLKNQPWILCRNTFHPTDKVIFSLPFDFQNNNSSIVELPEGYKNDFGYLFKAMGVRNEIEIKDLITIVSNMVKGNLDRNLSTDEIKKVIKALELISKIQRNIKIKRGENHPEKLDGLLVPSIENKLNADDAKATRFSIIIDERSKFQHNASNKSLFTEEMEDWQGPAIWIYNDATFTDKDFRSLIKLGVGGKGDDESKIGRFGLGFNCAFHLTDIPSLVSGKYIVFIDPSAKYLPAQGSPPRKCGGMKCNFIEKEFKKNFPEQCLPYEVMGCNFTEEFKGTLFRLPIRTSKLAEQSEISNQPVDIKKIFQLLSEVQSNKEMLFLRHIESCSLYRIEEQQESLQMIWQAQINHMLDTVNTERNRNIRKNFQKQSYAV
ncbi:19815_t:CDS:2, partial [Funneliformis geosporum]